MGYQLQEIHYYGGATSVGCEGTDGVLRVHFESETCDVCKDLQDNT